MKYELKPIATIKTDFPTKFGVPRQSGLIKGLRGRIVFEPEYRDPEALRGLEGFSHIWLLWDFSEARKASPKSSPEGKDLVPPFPLGEGAGKRHFRATVRPPRLGGNKRVGVFATRSPFRPNNIGLSSVRVLSIDLHTSDGPVIEVEGIDMMDGTPIFDIKPYLAFTDSHPDATGKTLSNSPLKGEDSDSQVSPLRGNLEGSSFSLHPSLIAAFDAEHLEALREILASDPRPHYQDDPDRVYAFEFAGKEVKFRVKPDQIEAWTE